MKKKLLDLSKVYQLLEPGPVVMVSTVSDKGRSNIMTMTWHMMVEFEPPLIACVISDQNYTFRILKKTKECVINIPDAELVETVVKIGEITGSKIDKFDKFHLTPECGSFVKAPLIRECFANLECKVVDMKMVTKYNIFILEVINAWIATSKKRQRMLHHCGSGVFVVDGKIVKLPFSKK